MSILNDRIVRIRDMTDEELEAEGWQNAPEHQRPPVIVLDSGTLIYPSKDPEGNGPGSLFGVEDGDAVFFQAADITTEGE